MNFSEIVESCRRIAIVGTYKNAGKTVALNEFIEAASARNIVIGVTSIGRDGERKDIVTDTEKPPIFAPAGTIVATAEECLSKFTASCEIVEVTPFQTAIGRVVVCRIKQPGYVEIAGPDTNDEIRAVCDHMESFGAQTILIDGALSRKTQASPAVADGVILSTGAVLSRSMETVIEKTKHAVKILTLPSVDDNIKDLCEDALSSSRIAFIDNKGSIITTNHRTALGSAGKILNLIKEEYEYILFPGSLTDSFIKLMHGVLRQKNIGIIVRDGTKVFTDSREYRLFERAGGRVQVVEPVNLLAVTVNPYSPEGYYFEPPLFLEAMKEALYPLSVFDCMQGGI